MIVAHLTAPDVARTVDGSTIVVQPIGAIEQHGPHLPLVADALVVDAVATRLEVRRPDIALLPTLSYGKSNEHQWAPGTVVLSTATLLGLLTDVGNSVSAMGARNLVFLNGHGGNNAILSTVARDLHVDAGLATYVVHPFLAYVGTSTEDPLDFHAGHSESSVVAHLAPDLVHLERGSANVPAKSGRHVGLTGSVEMGWTSDEFGDGSGTIGDPGAASAEAGAAVLGRMVDYAVECIDEISDRSRRS